MSDSYEDNNISKTKRRRCYYDFSKDYPGTRYDKNRRSSTTDELDGKRIVFRRVLAALAIVAVFVISYFIVYTVIGISHEDVEGLDSIGATTVSQDYSVTDEELIKMIRDRSEQRQQAQDVTEQAQDTAEQTQPSENNE